MQYVNDKLEKTNKHVLKFVANNIELFFWKLPFCRPVLDLTPELKPPHPIIPASAEPWLWVRAGHEWVNKEWGWGLLCCFTCPYCILYRGDCIADFLMPRTVWPLDEGKNHVCTSGLKLITSIMYKSHPSLVRTNWKTFKLILQQHATNMFCFACFAGASSLQYLFQEKEEMQ